MGTQQNDNYDASDPEQIGSAKGLDKQARDQLKRDLAFLMSKLPGRRVLWRLLTDAGVFHSSFGHDDRITSFREGKRALGLKWMTQMLQADMAQFLNMHRENLNEQ